MSALHFWNESDLTGRRHNLIRAFYLSVGSSSSVSVSVDDSFFLLPLHQTRIEPHIRKKRRRFYFTSGEIVNAGISDRVRNRASPSGIIFGVAAQSCFLLSLVSR
jgi:hypothetical protein